MRPPGGIAQSERSAGKPESGISGRRAQRISFPLLDHHLPQIYTHIYCLTVRERARASRPLQTAGQGVHGPCSHLRLTWGGPAAEMAQGGGRFISLWVQSGGSGQAPHNGHIHHQASTASPE